MDSNNRRRVVVTGAGGELLSKPVEIPFQADGRLVRGSRHLVGLATL
jgi:hypothetical protein